MFSSELLLYQYLESVNHGQVTLNVRWKQANKNFSKLCYPNMQWLICKKNKCGNAERRRRENRGAAGAAGAEGGRVWGGGVPSPPGEGSGERAMPLPRKILKFSSQNGEFWCKTKCYLQRFTACFYTQIEASTAHSTLP